MSRNYQLMQEMERNKAFFSGRLVEPEFPAPGQQRTRLVSSPPAGDMTLGLVQRIFLQQTQDPPRVVVFAAIDHGNGCSQIAVSAAENLAANAPGAVCLVEGNFRSPNLSRLLGTTNYHGLTDALLEPGNIRSYMKLVANESLWLLSSGPLSGEAPNLLNSERMRSRIAELRREFEFVVIDAPPISRYADAIALGKLADGVVVILEAESTRREAARIAVDNMRASKIPVLGAVLNKRTFPIPERLYRKL
jgi:protein-tyrosine kinase